MAQPSRVYETTFIVNASLDDPQIDTAIEKVKDIIAKASGEIIEIVKWGRKRFAFPIKKRNNGFYVVVAFRAPGDVITRLERYFQIDENILRFLIIMLDKVAVKSRLSGESLLKPSLPPGTPFPSPAPVPAPVSAPVPAPAAPPAAEAKP
jgi:small subunit ribosomal protein S6